MLDYFSRARTEIEPHLPVSVNRMLDVGCGDGATSAFIKSVRSVEWAGGVEVNAAAAKRAEGRLDAVWCADVEEFEFGRHIPPASLDLILCLDVLEHLVDPWSVVKHLSALLAANGRLVVSVPNIRNWKFVVKLLFRGDFNYRGAGLLDRTHLRFFVRQTAVELAGAGALPVEWIGNAHPWKAGDMRAILSRLSLGRLDDLMIKQYIVVAGKAGASPS
ncbi:MAG: methyltransferase [Hyphomicrobiaceae bacterium]